LTITENEHLWECLQSDTLRAERELEHREQEHWDSEYSRGYHEVHRGRDQGGEGNRTGYPASTKLVSGDRQRSKSSRSATPEVDSRQSDRRPADQRGGTSRPSYNMNRVFHGVRRDGQERQSRNGEEGIRGSTAEGHIREEECNHHFFGEDGGLLGREIINFVGKQQSRGKTWGTSGVRVVTIVIIWEGVLGGLVPPQM